MVSEALHSLRMMSGHDDEWVTLGGGGPGGEGTVVGADRQQHPREGKEPYCGWSSWQ